eukprot:TRINITY_DN5334_c0_g6_i3.p1 TRINITY_DN5334_c0_g6~~TRINITY_DN5334_c0_g6_i3.p1  ORF type:complete len:640 (+),score=203.42 TRINITY_DN5334_c0_g6_i3:92-2011(+)
MRKQRDYELSTLEEKMLLKNEEDLRAQKEKLTNQKIEALQQLSQDMTEKYHHEILILRAEMSSRQENALVVQRENLVKEKDEALFLLQQEMIGMKEEELRLLRESLLGEKELEFNGLLQRLNEERDAQFLFLRDELTAQSNRKLLDLSEKKDQERDDALRIKEEADLDTKTDEMNSLRKELEAHYEVEIRSVIQQSETEKEHLKHLLEEQDVTWRAILEQFEKQKAEDEAKLKVTQELYLNGEATTVALRTLIQELEDKIELFRQQCENGEARFIQQELKYQDVEAVLQDNLAQIKNQLLTEQRDKELLQTTISTLKEQNEIDSCRLKNQLEHISLKLQVLQEKLDREREERNKERSDMAQLRSDFDEVWVQRIEFQKELESVRKDLEDTEAALVDKDESARLLEGERESLLVQFEEHQRDLEQWKQRGLDQQRDLLAFKAQAEQLFEEKQEVSKMLKDEKLRMVQGRVDFDRQIRELRREIETLLQEKETNKKECERLELQVQQLLQEQEAPEEVFDRDCVSDEEMDRSVEDSTTPRRKVATTPKGPRRSKRLSLIPQNTPLKPRYLDKEEMEKENRETRLKVPKSRSKSRADPNDMTVTQLISCLASNPHCRKLPPQRQKKDYYVKLYLELEAEGQL